MDWRERVVADPEVMVGKPVIKGSRITVEFILDLLANEWSFEDIIDSYTGLTNEDISACINYAHELVKGVKVYPLSA